MERCTLAADLYVVVGVLGVKAGRATAWCEVGAFYWTVLAPGIVNSGREEQGSVSV